MSDSSSKNKAAKIDHVLFMVFDAMRPDYIERFDLKNFKKLLAISQNYSEATVGYIGSETVVSHLVFETGLQPKNLPWGDDVYYDLNGILGEKEKFYSTGDLTFEQMTTLLKALPASDFLAAKLKKKFNRSVVAIGQKNYATFAMGTPEADSIITIKKKNGKCSFDGIRIPEYLLKNDRFNLECSEKYGTDKTFYPLDGNRFVPGNDLAHLGGDAWVTDAAFEVMNHQAWSGLFLTFGAIDKIAHQLGEQDAPPRPSLTKDIQAPYDLKFVLNNADQQLGRILNRLEKDGLLKSTLIVVTADHGGQSDYHYLGNGNSSKWGPIKNEKISKAPKWVRSFTHFKGVKYSFQDSAIRTWLDAKAPKKEILEALKKVPGAIEIYQLNHIENEWKYLRVYSQLIKQTPRARDWSKKHNAEIISAIPNERAPTLITLLDDGYGFDLVGDHGGAQENVQRVPYILSIPGLDAKNIRESVHLYDLKKLIEKYI